MIFSFFQKFETFAADLEDGEFALFAPVGAEDVAGDGELMDEAADVGGRSAGDGGHELGRGGVGMGDQIIQDGPGSGHQFGGLIIGGGEPKTVLGEVGTGVKRRGSEVAGFEAAEANEGVARIGFDGQHEVDCGGDGGRAAEDTVLVVVVQDEDGGLGRFGEAAKVEQDGLDGGNCVLVATVHNVGQSVYDDEADAEGLSLLDDGEAIVPGAKVETRQGAVMQGGLRAGLVGMENAMQASPDAGEAGFFIYEQGRGGFDGTTQPGFAQGDADGEIEGQVGLFGAGIADEDVEAGAGEEAFDAPVEDGRRGQRFGGRVDVTLKDVEEVGKANRMCIHKNPLWNVG